MLDKAEYTYGSIAAWDWLMQQYCTKYIVQIFNLSESSNTGWNEKNIYVS